MYEKQSARGSGGRWPARVTRRRFLGGTLALAGALVASTVVPVGASASGARRRPLLLVHGYLDRAATWQRPENLVVARLTALGYQLDSSSLLPFVYPASEVSPSEEDSRGDIGLAGAALARLVEQTAARAASGQVDLLGFSMGGLVIRAALQSLGASGGARPPVNTAVLIATPNRGVDLLELIRDLGEQAQLALGDVPVDLSRFELETIAARQMLPSSEFLQALNLGARQDQRVQYALVAGSAELEVMFGRFRGLIPLGDGLISAASATFLPGRTASVYLLPDHLGSGELPPWEAIQQSDVFHNRLLFNDDVALAAVAELAPEAAEARAELENRLQSGRVVLKPRA